MPNEYILILLLIALLILTNICWYFERKKVDEKWQTLLRRNTEDWRIHSDYIGENWSSFCKDILKAEKEGADNG
jgi:hypothetical protein